jgi:outer membrane protein TolC
MKHYFLLAICILLSACAVGPDYVRPPALTHAAMPQHFKEVGSKNNVNNKRTLATNQAWKVVAPQEAIDRGTWWEIFNDPLLRNRIKSC